MRSTGGGKLEREGGTRTDSSGLPCDGDCQSRAAEASHLRLYDPSPIYSEPASTFGSAKRVLVSALLIPALVAGALSMAMLSRSNQHDDFAALEPILKENRGLEWAQVSVLALTSAICWGAFRAGNPVLHRAFAVVPMLLALRELDALFLNHISENLHRVLMGSMTAGVAWLAWRHREELVPQFRDFTRRPGFYHLLFGCSLVAIYAQILGQRDLWDMLGKNGPLGKRFVEEGLELFGYVTIACGICEERFFGLTTQVTPILQRENPVEEVAALKKAA